MNCADCVIKVKDMLHNIDSKSDCHDFAQKVYDKGRSDTLEKILKEVLPLLGCPHGG